MVERILEYMAVTYGKRVWVMDWKNPPNGWRAHAFDFSQTNQNPFFMENIPEYEKRWFISAIMRDAQASHAEQKGLKWFWFIDPIPDHVNNTELLPIEVI